MPLDVDAAKAALKKIADPLRMSIEDVAQAMFTTVNSNMADGITEISTKKGYDVRDFSLLAIGGSTAFCAMFIADLLNIKKVVIRDSPLPLVPGACSPWISGGTT